MDGGRGQNVAIHLLTAAAAMTGYAVSYSSIER